MPFGTGTIAHAGLGQDIYGVCPGRLIIIYEGEDTRQEEEALKTRWKVAIITLLVGGSAFLAAPAVRRASAGAETSTIETPFLVFSGAVEALSLGLGVAFILFGWPRILRNTDSSRTRTIAVCASVSWLLVSWWPHANLVRYLGEESARTLTYLEYGFQATLIVCGVVLAYSLLRYDPLLREVRRMTRIS
jgi:hypothetical protein